MQAIGINNQERDELFKVLGAILHLGNMQFGKDKDGGATLSPQVSPNIALIAPQ